MASAQAAQKSSRAPVVERLCLLEDDNQGLAQLCGPLEQNLRGCRRVAMPPGYPAEGCK